MITLFSSRVRQQAAVWEVFLFVLFAAAVSAPLTLHAGGRFGSKICWDGGCAFKPAPKTNNDSDYVKKALNAVFAEEEKGRPSVQAFIENPKGQSPFALALAEFRSLKSTNAKITDEEFAEVLRAKKQAITLEWGIAAYLDALDNPPVVTSFSPVEGTTTDTITITGRNLLPVTHVDFNGTLAYVERPSANQIVVSVPKYINTIAGLPQAGMPTQFPLIVLSKYGTKMQAPGTFQWLAGNCTDVRITQAFQEMYGRPPRGTGTNGECNVANYPAFASVTDLMASLVVRGRVVQKPAPVITNISTGRAQPGTVISIDGLDLSQIKEVWFGAAKAPSFQSVNSYSLKATVPQDGTGKIRIVTYSGSVETPYEFEVTTPPTIESVTPKEVVKGDPIFVHGKNFASDASGTLDGNISLNFRSRTPTDIVVSTDNVNHAPNAALVISGSGGAASTTVTVWIGMCTDPQITGAFDDLYARKPLGGYKEGECNPSAYGTWNSYETLLKNVRAVHGPPSSARLPTISGVSPSSGSPGGLVTIRGSNFPYQATTVQFGNVLSREVSWQSRTEVQARIPEGAPNGSVTVNTPSGSVSAAFAMKEPLRLSRITPGSGLVGSTIRISGKGFDGASVTIGGTSAQANILSSSEIDAVIPEGVSGYVDVTVVSPDKMSVTKPKFPIYSISLRLPDGSKNLKETRVELVGPDGRSVGTSHLIGNAGASLSATQISTLIGNAGAGLIGNAGAGLIANGTARLSLDQLGKLIGNAGASFNGKGVTDLIGNAGAGFKLDLSRLIGNAGSALAGNAGSTLAGNAGSTLAGNAGSTLAGNAGSTLAGNAGSTLAGNAGSTLAGNAGSTLAGNAGSTLAGNAGSTLAGNAGSTLAGNAGSSLTRGRITSGSMDLMGEFLSIGAARGVGSRSISSLGQTPMIVPTSTTEFVVPLPAAQETPAPEAKSETAATQSAPQESTTIAPTESAAPAVSANTSTSTETSAPSTSQETTTPSAPIVSESPTVLPEEEPAASPQTGTTQTEETPTSSGQVCNPNVPLYQQPGCIEEPVEAAPRSPYDGLPCPGDSVPSYSKIGCIPQ